MTRYVLIASLLLQSCYPPQRSEAFETRPIERSILRDAIAFKKLCPSDCGVVRVYEDELVHIALAEVLDQGFTKIRFSRHDLNDVRIRYGEDAPLGILAHEFGHHLDYLLNGEPTHPWLGEYRADRWAGCMIGTIDANVEPLRAFLLAEAMGFSKTHPPGDMRAEEVLEGYRACLH